MSEFGLLYGVNEPMDGPGFAYDPMRSIFMEIRPCALCGSSNLRPTLGRTISWIDCKGCGVVEVCDAISIPELVDQWNAVQAERLAQPDPHGSVSPEGSGGIRQWFRRVLGLARS